MTMFSVTLTLPVLRYAADVVAAQVDQLQMFGAVPWGRPAVPLPARSSSRVSPRGRVPAMGRSGDGVAFQADQDFRRGADDMEIAHVVIEHVGRRIEAAQRAVQRQRRGGERPAHALGQHHLHDVAVGDVCLAFCTAALNAVLAEFGLGLVAAHRRLVPGDATGWLQPARPVRPGADAPAHRHPACIGIGIDDEGRACRSGCRPPPVPRSASAGCPACAARRACACRPAASRCSGRCRSRNSRPGRR